MHERYRRQTDVRQQIANVNVSSRSLKTVTRSKQQSECKKLDKPENVRLAVNEYQINKLASLRIILHTSTYTSTITVQLQ